MPEFTGHNDLRGYIRILWRWKLIFLLFVIGAPVAAWLLGHNKPKVYRSSALIGINQANVSSAANGGSGFTTNNVTAIADLITTSPVAELAGSLMHPPQRAGAIVGEVSANGDPSTNFITVSAEDRDPRRAAAIANAFAGAIGLNRQQAALSAINSSIAAVQAQLKTATDAATRAQLQQQLTTLEAAKASPGGQSSVLQPAAPSGTPVGLALRRTIELGLVIGLLLGIGAVLLAEDADRRIRTPDDLERMTDLPLLAAIPPTAFSESLDTTREDEESFNMLRTALRYFNVDRKLESVIVTSPGEQDGKTTVATRLAISAANAGLRVTLVDGDLRRAQVSEKLGIRAKHGLGAVLIGDRKLTDELVDYRLSASGAGKLSVLPAGPPPPNPSALIASSEMERVLAELESSSDLVIVDTPAALAVSDPLPLMPLVSGVVLVARMNRSSRGPINRLRRMIEAANGTLVGVVATGVVSGPGYAEYSPKYYTQVEIDAKRSRFRFRGRSKPPAPRTDVTRRVMGGLPSYAPPPKKTAKRVAAADGAGAPPAPDKDGEKPRDHPMFRP